MAVKFGTEEGTEEGTFTPIGAPMGVKFGMEEGTHRCNVSPLRGEKPQNRPLSKLNTGRFALCAMLPVMRSVCCVGRPEEI